MRPRASRFLCAALAAFCLPAAAQTLNTDTTAAPYHAVVYLTATGSGTITFTDNAAPIASLPANAAGIAVLGIATLTPGTHTLAATSAHGTSAAVTVTIAPQPAPFQLSADSSLLFQHTPLNFAITGLPVLATGTITYQQDGVPLITAPFSHNSPVPTYHAFGDSITSGFGIGNFYAHYPSLFAAANGFGLFDTHATPAAIACDMLPGFILPYQAGPTQDTAPLTSLMIGSSDMDNIGLTPGEANFLTCHRAALAWLAIPREYKILPADPATTILSGAWSLPPAPIYGQIDPTYATLYNSSGAGAAQFAVTSNGGPLYLWYLLADHLTGAFTVTLDGTPTGITYTTNPANPINSSNNPDSVGFALLRLPATAGPHTLRVDILQGTVGLLAAATPSSPGAASIHPTVFASDIPNQNPALAEATPALIQQFSADALADVALLAADGLDIRPVPTHTFLTADAANFLDFAHPSLLGHQLLATAFQSAFAATPTAPYATYSAFIPRYGINADTLGTHTYTATYSGDAIYAPYTSAITVQVVPTGHSVTTLAAPATTFYAAQPVTATAVIFPANPGATVALMEGTQVLATANAAGNSTGFSLPLSAGVHILYAAYAGDATNAASISPPLAVQVLKNLATLSLSSAAETPYAAPVTLSVALTPASATGIVTFADTYTPNGQAAAQSSLTQTLGQATLAAGAASFTPAALLPGTHTITATYAGDPSNNPATSAPAVTLIDTIPTATTLAATTAPYGKPSAFTATVSPAAATGTLTFTDSTSGATFQTAILNCAATWTTATFSPGPHTLTASSSGDATHAPSTSAPLLVTIARDPSTTLLMLSTPSVYTGTPVTFTVAVSPTTATGTILLSDPVAGTLGQAPLTAGTATLTLPALPAGTYAVSATYSGDPTTLPSTSAPVALQVLPRTTVTTLSAPAAAPYSTSVTISASVAPAPASGLIRFTENGTLLGSAALTSGTATFTTAALTTGPHTVLATYPGDSTHDPSSATVSLTTTPNTSATTLTLAQASVLAGSTITVNLRVAASAAASPTGTVVLRSGATTLATATLTNGSGASAYASVTLPTSTAGTFPLTAFYLGDTNTTASDSTATPLAYTVSPRIASGALTLSSTQVPLQTPVTLWAAFSSLATSGPALVPTGSVTFSNGTTAVATVPLDATGKAAALLSAAALGSYTLTAVYTPTGVFTAAPIAPQTLLVTPPLALAFPAPTLTLAPGTSADTTATLTPLSGFQGAISTQCTTDTPYLTCTLDAPTTLTTAATAHLHLAVPSKMAALTPRTTPLLLACLLPFLLTRKRRRHLALLAVLCAATLLPTLTGCAQGGSFGDIPPGTHYLHLTATAANTPTTATLTVNIQ